MPLNPFGAIRGATRPIRKIPRLPAPPGLAGAASGAIGGGKLPPLTPGMPPSGLLPKPGLPGPTPPPDWMGGIVKGPPAVLPPSGPEQNLPGDDAPLPPSGPPMINIPPEEAAGPPAGGVMPPPAPPDAVLGGAGGGPGPMDLPPGGSTMPPKRARLGAFDPRAKRF